MKMLFKQDVEEMLGSPDTVREDETIHLNKRVCYNVTDDLAFTCVYNSENRLLYLNWFEKRKDRLFYVKLENIFEKLPAHWQNLVIFNWDLFQKTEYRF